LLLAVIAGLDRFTTPLENAVFPSLLFAECPEQARDLQRQLLEIAGPPAADALRAEYTKQIEDAEGMADYYARMCADINFGGAGLRDAGKEMAKLKANLAREQEHIRQLKQARDAL
jgi:hypothetical protein